MAARKYWPALALAFVGIAAVAPPSTAGSGSGTVGAVVVGRLGYQVFAQLLNASIAGFPCGTPHPNGYNFAFTTQSSGGKDLLATVLAAKASGAQLYFVGSGTCAQDGQIEDTSYIIAL